MPSTSLFGCRLRQLSTDNFCFFFMVAVVQVVWLFIYWIGIVAFSRPQQCDPGTQSASQDFAIVYSCLALFIAQAAVTVAAALLTLRGTPLEPATKRRWVGIASYAYLASLPINAGMLAWACWVVRASDGSCWSSGARSMATSIFFGGLGVLLGQAIGVAVSYNQLGDVRHGNSWHSVTRTGVSSLIHLCGSWRAEHRGPATTLEEIVTELQQLMGGIEADKTDVVAGLACAALLQDEAAAAAPPEKLADAGQAGAVANGADGAGSEGDRQKEQKEAERSSVKAAGSAAALAASAAAVAAAFSVVDGGGSWLDARVMAWAEGVCRGAAAALPDAGPAATGAGAAAAAGAASQPPQASAQEVEDTLCWARYASAAYGARQHYWRRGKEQGWWVARGQLRALAAAAAAEGAQPLAGWPKQQPSRQERRDFAAARELLGGPSASSQSQIAWFSSGHEPSGLLPHLVALDRERQVVVLGIAGNWQRPHAVPQVQTVLPEWLVSSGSEAAAEAGHGTGNISNTGSSSGSSSWVHRDSLEAAEAVAAELERCQVLQQLLRRSGGSCAHDGTTVRSEAEAEGALSGLGCVGWQLVVSGHGLGAGAAALLALKMQSWNLGHAGRPAVWALCPPAQLCSPDLGAALAGACSLTCVAVGDDAAPRASLAALQLLVEQAVVGLARLRYSKTGLLAALVAERLGPKRWEGRWYSHARALRPLGEASAEAVAYLHRFHTWQQEQQEGVRKSGSLPGRMLRLSRVQQLEASGAPAADADSADDDNSSSSSINRGGQPAGGRSTADGHSSEQSWQAVWQDPGEAAGWGVRVSRNVLADHYVSTLLGVLGDLTAAQDQVPADAATAAASAAAVSSSNTAV